MKTPTLKEVRAYFKDAKIVECLYNADEIDITKGIIKEIYFEDEDIAYLIDIDKHRGTNVYLWSKKRGYATILKYKDKNIIGYQLIKPYLKQAVEIGAKGNINRFTICTEYDSVNKIIPLGGFKSTIDNLKEAGVLDIWFTPVYKKELKLPEISGYMGLEVGDSITYGCEEFKKEDLIKVFDILNLSSFNLEIEGETVKVSKKQTKELKNYLTKR